MPQFIPAPDPTDPSRSLPIVVGAHPLAEIEDRPIAGALLRAVHARTGPDYPLAPLVLTDLWYLNTDALRARPTISIGRPECNALSAFVADKLPSVHAVDGRSVVLLDPELHEPVACCWGVDSVSTAEAVHAFSTRWLDRFLDAAARRP
jgi:hypothetical protein